MKLSKFIFFSIVILCNDSLHSKISVSRLDHVFIVEFIFSYMKAASRTCRRISCNSSPRSPMMSVCILWLEIRSTLSSKRTLLQYLSSTTIPRGLHPTQRYSSLRWTPSFCLLYAAQLNVLRFESEKFTLYTWMCAWSLMGRKWQARLHMCHRFLSIKADEVCPRRWQTQLVQDSHELQRNLTMLFTRECLAYLEVHQLNIIFSNLFHGMIITIVYYVYQCDLNHWWVFIDSKYICWNDDSIT